MKKTILLFILTALVLTSYSQSVGDTIKVKTFHYGSNTRDTVIAFPKNNLSYEKIIMKYNMRCKNALISTGTNRNLGCGEWDYSCNTYIVDSSKIESVLSTQPNFIINNFTGNNFKYTLTKPYDKFSFTQQKTTIDSILSENIYSLANGIDSVKNFLKTDEKSGKSQIIYKAAELISSGITAGSINGLTLTVLNNGGKANFLKIKIKGVTNSSLSSSNLILTGFTEVFNQNYTFINGENTIRFKTPFVWDGIQNLIIEVSFTNTEPQNPIVFLGNSDTTTVALFANNNYAVDLMNQGFMKLDTTGFSLINKELTISFWAFGNAASMPTTTTILYGFSNNANDRQLSIHLPHSSNNIYFDCGFAGGYDRINKIATAQEQGGKWNHWTFTKNAISGSMKIYLNGSVWHTGTGLNKAITLLNLLLGKDQNKGGNYKGKINELVIFNKEIPDSIIANWRNRPINNKHPFYNNLVSYYPFNEAEGLTIKNAVSTNTIIGENLIWTFDRGENLNRTFFENNSRPNIKLIKGNYLLSNQNILVDDSVGRKTSTIEKYSIISKEGVSPLTNDVINLDTIYTNYYSAENIKIFNGDSSNVISTLPLTADGEFNIANLNFFRRYPFYNEIMSFVTPYGIGLDLGVSGKTWYFDVSDFEPLLKENKRIVMTLGGQNQEQMDVEFWFIVGTPVRKVLEFNQIWQGTNRTGAPSIGSINNETTYSALTVPTLNTGKAFKIRSSITGHGAEGEFESNGGPVYHSINLNGGATEFNWSVYQKCASNPVFPQGGTWVYDRQGWCPGQSSLLKENNITSFVTPGSPIEIDYNASLPSNSSGDYRYQIAHQLVTYGEPSFNLDARILEVIEPSDKILHGKYNPACAQPKIIVQNTGKTTITSLLLHYWVNESTVKQIHTWTGNIAFLDTVSITLPTHWLWYNGITASNNKFYVEIKSVNNTNDEYVYNNKYESPFNKPEVVTGKFTIDVKTNNNPSENSYKLYDSEGKLVDSKTFDKANTLFSNTYTLSGCFRLVVDDLGEDGMNWWANPNQGTGFVRLKNDAGFVIKTLQPDFGRFIEYGFTTNWRLNNEELDNEINFELYPNPTTNSFIIEGSNIEKSTIQIIDVLGHEFVLPKNSIELNKMEINSNTLKPGIYFVTISNNGSQKVKQLIIY